MNTYPTIAFIYLESKSFIYRTQDELNEAKNDVEDLVELVKTKDKMLEDKNIEIERLKNGLWSDSENNSLIY